MDSTVWNHVYIGSICALLVLVFIRWWFQSNEAEQMEQIDELPDGGDILRDETLEPRHKVFLSHNGAQKNFVEQLCEDLERHDRYPFFDKRRYSLPIGKHFPKLIFETIEHCEVGVVVLSEEFFMRSKWPMLELVAMMKNPKLVIIPVFLGISLEEVRDPKNCKRWLSMWHGWAKNDKKRIDIEEWCAALKALRPINSLVYDGEGEVSFREKIVKAVCDVVLPETRWTDCHVQGRSRLCKVITKRIDEAKVCKEYGVRLVGLYGVGGIGKTTICQTLCNEYSVKMRGRVFHAELGSGSDLELLHGALKHLSEKSNDVICGLNMSQCQELLKREMQKQPIFLAIDNVFDNMKSIEQAKIFLSAGFHHGSVVMVTSRSLEVLKLHHLNIDESNCLEMPELEEDEARSLFLQHAMHDQETRKRVDDEVITNCLKRCYFRKGDGRSYHYHPLALKVLGVQLGCNKYDPVKWGEQLEELDTFNLQRESDHPIFSILRKSFDTLLVEDRLLFMDVALYLPKSLQVVSDFKCDVFGWLSMVYGISMRNVMERLESLKRKSLLDDMGDEQSTRIGMHDLWREFAVTETMAGKFECRSWVYEVGEPSAVEEGAPSGGCWQNVKRMCFMGDGLESVKRINLDHFSNIIVMKVVGNFEPPVDLVLDVKGLKHLKSFELDFYHGAGVQVFGLRMLESLRVLILRHVQVCATCVDDIGLLTNLRVLVLTGFRGESLPDLSKLVFLEEVDFSWCTRVATISGFSSRLRNLRVLDLDACYELRSVGPGVGKLVGLEKLSLMGCGKLDELPDLQKLTNLRKLEISDSRRIKSLPGLGDLIALQQLEASGCSGLAELPDMRKLTNLQVLNLWKCALESAPGMGDLIALQRLDVNFEQLQHRPDLQRLSSLRTLFIEGCSSAELKGVENLSMLKRLTMVDCNVVDAVPDFLNLTRLKELSVQKCEFKGVSGLSGLTALESLEIRCCPCLERLPDMHELTRLKVLRVRDCGLLRDVLGIGTLSRLERLACRDSPLLKEVPDLSNFPQLKELDLGGCEIESLLYSTCFGHLTALECVDLGGWRSLKAVPDLSNYPRLVRLTLKGCGSLMELTCTGRLTAFQILDLGGCRSLNAVPDLSNFPRLEELTLSGCESLMELTCSGRVSSLEDLGLGYCRSLISMLDLSNFPGLVWISLKGCGSLTELTCAGPLATLVKLDLGGCRSLNAVPDLSNFSGLCELTLSGCESLMELTCAGRLTALVRLNLGGCRSLNAVPDLSNFPGLWVLTLSGCESLMELTCTGSVSSLDELNLGYCRSLISMPDLSSFPALWMLDLWGYESLTELTCTWPLASLRELNVCDCPILNAMPDLSNFPKLELLQLSGCKSLIGLSCTGSVAALRQLYLSGCLSLESVPDLSYFPELVTLHLICCEGLKELTCSGPLTALEEVMLGGCLSLEAVPDLSNFPQLVTLWVSGCMSLKEVTCTGATAALERLYLDGCEMVVKV